MVWIVVLTLRRKEAENLDYCQVDAGGDLMDWN